jgi:hypothetical protein
MAGTGRRYGTRGKRAMGQERDDGEREVGDDGHRDREVSPLGVLLNGRSVASDVAGEI